MGNFLDWYYRYVQKNDDNHIINNIENKILFRRGLKNYFNLHITGDDIMDMDNIYTVTYFDEPILNNEALHYLLEKKGNIISVIGADNYIINNGDHFSSCTVADIGDDYTLSELVTTFFNNNDKVWVKGTFEKTDNLLWIQQTVVDYLEELNKVTLKNDEISFLKKEKLYNMLYSCMQAMYDYFNNDYKEKDIEIKIDYSKLFENK